MKKMGTKIDELIIIIFPLRLRANALLKVILNWIFFLFSFFEFKFYDAIGSAYITHFQGYKVC